MTEIEGKTKFLVTGDYITGVALEDVVQDNALYYDPELYMTVREQFRCGLMKISRIAKRGHQKKVCDYFVFVS